MCQRFDLVFTLEHPTPMGTSPIRRQTALGGLLSITGVLLAVLVLSYLINRYFGTRKAFRLTAMLRRT